MVGSVVCDVAYRCWKAAFRSRENRGGGGGCWRGGGGVECVGGGLGGGGWGGGGLGGGWWGGGGWVGGGGRGGGGGGCFDGNRWTYFFAATMTPSRKRYCLEC